MDAMSKSTLYILDAEDQLSSMKLEDNEDSATHLSGLKQHFQLTVRDKTFQMFVEVGLFLE